MIKHICKLIGANIQYVETSCQTDVPLASIAENDPANLLLGSSFILDLYAGVFLIATWPIIAEQPCAAQFTHSPDFQLQTTSPTIKSQLVLFMTTEIARETMKETKDIM